MKQRRSTTYTVIAVIDDDGLWDTDTVTPLDGQRGFATRGLLADALDAIRIRSLMEACDDDDDEEDYQ